MKVNLKKLFTNVRFYFSIVAVLLVSVTVAQIYIRASSHEVGYIESGKPFDTENIQAAAPATEEFGANKGMISLRCSSLGGGGVYVYINNTMKANITSTELKNLKVKKGDVVIIKGHSLQSDITVTIDAAVGNIDTTIAGKSVTVGNLGKYLVSIK